MRIERDRRARVEPGREPRGKISLRRGATEAPTSTMNREFHDALLSAGADEAKARAAAISVARYDGDFGGTETSLADIKSSLVLLKWMVGFTLALVVALTWRVFH